MKEKKVGGGGSWDEMEIFFSSPLYVLQAITSSLYRERGLCFWKETLNGAFYAWLSADTKMLGLLLHI